MIKDTSRRVFHESSGQNSQIDVAGDTDTHMAPDCSNECFYALKTFASKFTGLVGNTGKLYCFGYKCPHNKSAKLRDAKGG